MEDWEKDFEIYLRFHNYLSSGWMGGSAWCGRGPCLTCRSHWCRLMVKIMMMTKMMVKVMMTIIMSGKVVGLPGVD